MSGDWLGELGKRCGWTAADLDRASRAACRGLNSTDADDICQEVARAIGSAFRFGVPTRIRKRDEVEAYIFTVARNIRWKFLKKRALERRRLAHIDPLDLTAARAKPIHESAPQAAVVVLGELTEHQREHIVALLPEDRRRLRIFFRLYLGGMSGKEIARQLGTSSSTVTRRLAECEELLDEDSLAAIMRASLPESQPSDGGVRP